MAKGFRFVFAIVVTFVVIDVSEESKCKYFMEKSGQEDTKHQAAGSKTKAERFCWG